jgi:hypothetical protein
MPRRLIVVTALAAGMSVAAVLSLAMPALAKGPSQASITGPGWFARSSSPAKASQGSWARSRCSPVKPVCTARCSVPISLVFPRRRLRCGPRRRRPTSARGRRSATPFPVSPPARRAVRADRPGSLPGPGRRAGHLHPARPGRLRAVTAGHRMAPGQSPVDPYPDPARRSAATGHTGIPADSPVRRPFSGSASDGHTSSGLAHRGSRRHRGRSTRRRRAASSAQASHRARL